MSPIILDAPSVAAALTNVDVVATLKRMFTELGHDRATQPAQTLTLFPEGKGDFITYQGVLERQGVFGAKLSPYIVTVGKPIITAWTCLMSMHTGKPLLLCDAGQLTIERTAGTTALAVELLAKPNSKKLAIIGSGAIAQAHWRHVEGLYDWNEVNIWSPNLSSNAGNKKTWQDTCPKATIAESADSAVEDADVVMLCTSSGTPVIEPSAIKQDALVTSISTNVAKAHEVPPTFLLSSQVYCDNTATTPHTAGEMILASQDHGWSPKSVLGDLAELTTGNCSKPNHSSPTFFRSVGLGLEDIAIANAIYMAASNH